MIKLELSLEEINKVLIHLSKGTFEQVADLITKIKEQAVPQLNLEAEEPKQEDK